ncbi:hypothetical protein AC578_7345 [Pseudocercospora eumusae]|uniref:Uncharacterized protein n=1 Tax=Pseudocercospora eumusae TaxID=321146 RepID=A0A139HWB2_9PEZI|nr:hypothetical protein AC578_7345 [Pseudocercospora eumusae]
MKCLRFQPSASIPLVVGGRQVGNTMSRASYIVQRNPEYEEIAVDDIRAAPMSNDEQSRKLLSMIARGGNSLRGTRAFRIGNTNELENYVKAIGTQLFLPYSAAGNHWPSPQRHMPVTPGGSEL